MSGKEPLSGLQMAGFLLVFSQHRSSLSRFSSCNGSDPTQGPHLHDLITSQMCCLLITITMGGWGLGRGRPSTHEFGETVFRPERAHSHSSVQTLISTSDTFCWFKKYLNRGRIFWPKMQENIFVQCFSFNHNVYFDFFNNYFVVCFITKSSNNSDILFCTILRVCTLMHQGFTQKLHLLSSLTCHYPALLPQGD